MDVYGFVSRLLLLAVLVAACLFGIERSSLPAPSEPPQPVLAAAARPIDGEAGFANLTLSSEDGVSLEQAYLLINGERAGSFAHGTLQVRVYDGDLLAVDCRAYDRELCFTVDEMSASVEERYLPRRFSCRGEAAVWGFIVMRQL
ncbi:MAG: hypothetical protein IJI40_05815 [Firmicutes bacterium]|nr:hypothetical protein [Bacillota bacterium]MBQ6607217.1 hypothetical protein [Bacillota bacterium]